MLDKTIADYRDFSVGAVRTIRGSYGFDVFLRYANHPAVRQQHSGFKGKKEAEKARITVTGELYTRTYKVFRGVRVADFMEFWLEEEVQPKVGSYETGYNYSRVVHKHIIPMIGGCKMDMLTPRDIKGLFDEKAEYSRSVAEQVKTVLTRALNFAVQMNIIQTNPAKGLRLSRKEDGKAIGYHRRRIDTQRTLTVEQVQILLEKSKGSKIYLMILFNVLMGLRRSEILGLKYSDIDYDTHTIRVERQLGRLPGSKKEELAPKTFTKQEIPPKTRSGNRVLPIPDVVFEAILQERVVYESNRSRRPNAFQDDGYIICSSYGKPRSRDFHWQIFKKLLKDCGLPDIRWHDLRVTYSTILLKNNFSAKAVSKLMGHEKELITVDVYGDNRGMIADGVPEMDAYIDRLPIANKEQKPGKETLDIGIDISAFINPKKNE